MRIKFDLNFFPSVNRIKRFFIAGDLLLWAGWGFVDPLFSIYIVQKVEGGNLLSIGYLTIIFWATRAITQVPISLFLDKTDGEKDDFYTLIIGLLVIGVSAFSLIAATTINQIYIIQFIKALGFSLYIPAWAAIFTRHLDKTHSAFEWAISSSSVGLGIGIAGFLGSWIADASGFKLVFLMAGLMAITGACVLLFVPDLILPKKTVKAEIIGDHIRAGLK